MILDALLNLKKEITIKDGRIIRITLDKEGNRALRNEIHVPEACEKMILGIVIDQISECPTCGQDMKLE